jgi:hypothetical protein
MFLFRHATFAQWDTFLHVAANFLLYPQYSWVLSFGFWWRSTATFWTLAASSVLQLAFLQPLPWGSPDAPLWIASFLDWVQSSSLLGRQSSLFSHPLGPSAMHQVWISSLLGQI